MPHARRSLRQAKKKASAKENQEEWLAVLASAPKGRNTRGLPTLPDELLDQILSYFPPGPSNTNSDDVSQVQTYTDARKETLYSLTHLCSNLRRFFWPYVWERIEVREGMLVGSPPIRLRRYGEREVTKAYATELVRQLEIVTIRDPSLARFVKILNIEITDFSVHTVLLELARCMGLFSNLQSVEIRTAVLDSKFPETAVRRAFRDHVYPQISMAILSETFWPLLNSCPKIKSFRATSYVSMQRLLPYLVKTPSIDHIGLTLQNLRFVAESLPNLKEVTIELNPPPFSPYFGREWLSSIIEEVGNFRNLDVLVFETFRLSSRSTRDGRPDDDFQTCTIFAQKVFKALKETRHLPPRRVGFKMYSDDIMDPMYHKTFTSQDLV